MTNETRPRRKIANLVIDRGALARLSIPFIIMILFSLGIVLAMRWQVMQALRNTELQGVENLPAMNALLTMQNTVTTIGVLGVLFFAFACFVLWIVFSHRIFGPTVPMRRHIQKLVDGDYASRVHLRTSDEFKAMSDELNHLAEVLAERKSKSG